MNKIILTIFSLMIFCGVYAQTPKTQIYGRITDASGKPIPLVNILIKDNLQGVVTDYKGKYKISVPGDKEIKVVFSCVGYQDEVRKLKISKNDTKELNIILSKSTTTLKDLVIEDKRTRQSTVHSINPTTVTKIVGANNSIESLLKTLPGVSANNELSNQYAVRGGNFDENLIYVNGIRIYRPFLVRSGQQEGLSFVNSDLVSSILFSAGGFDAKYGDKMSSVLDIRYKTPTEFGGSFTGSLLGASLHLEGLAAKKKLSYLVGFRQKSNQYVLKGLQEEGEYRPSFSDLQTLISYNPNERWSFSFLGNINRNVYQFVPSIRETDFGTFREALRLKIFFEGNENDYFLNYTGGFSATFRPYQGLKLQFNTSNYNSNENETFDIRGDYWIGRLNTNLGDENYGEVIEKQGVGTFINHARNYLDVNIWSAEHQGRYYSDSHEMEWGAKFQHETVNEQLREWTLQDSAGYTLPHPYIFPGQLEPPHYPLEMNGFLKSKNALESNRVSGYIQDTRKISKTHDLSLTMGVRATFWDFTDEFLVSPRATISYQPNWEKDIVFRLSGGYYHQPPLYKELINHQGVLLKDVKSQESIHFVLGGDWNFKAWNRPFKLVTELYYKNLRHLIPYEVDNVRIRYFPELSSHGYTTGIDMKVNGEFVPGLESWISLSVMNTMEDIEGDYVERNYDAEGNLVSSNSSQEIAYTEREEIGYRPRPLDQRVNFSMFFQDFIPKLPTYKMNMRLLFGTGLPIEYPGSKNTKSTVRIPSYKRVDIGFSKQIIGGASKIKPTRFFKHFDSMWVSLEVFNLLDFKNTISYFWVTDIHNQQLAVPNYLTPRQINLKLHLEF